MGGQQVYVSTMVSSSGSNPTYVIDASTGQYLRRLDTAAQWSNFAPPTAFGDGIYIASGYYGGEVYDFNASTGVLRWNKYGGSTSIWDGQTPAVDEGNVYYYSGLTIDVFDRTTGKILKSIPNPHFTWGGYSYVGGPILGSNDNVIVFPSSFTLWAEQQPPSPLANFSLTSEKATWKSQNVYSTVPALAKGVVYVARNAPARLDALSEETGQILWSWTPPTSSESFIGNLIATDNLVFVSSNTRLYAISLSDPAHPSVWQADTPGFISIASDFTLLVAVRGASPTNRLVAYNLR